MSAATAPSTIKLREFDNADWPVVWRWLQRYRSLVFHDHGPQTQREFVDAHMARNSRNLAVYRDGELVGLVIFDHITPVVCECHIYFKRSFWGRERTIPALRLAYQWAERAGYEKMTSPVLATNRLMIGLLKRLGAVQEGHFRAHTRQNGRPVDMEYWSIFKGGFNG